MRLPARKRHAEPGTSAVSGGACLEEYAIAPPRPMRGQPSARAVHHPAGDRRTGVSALDELIVGLDAAILVEDENLQAGACRCAAVGGNHLPGELDDVAETVCVLSRLEGEVSRGDELLVSAGHPHFELVVPAGFEDGRGET